MRRLLALLLLIPLASGQAPIIVAEGEVLEVDAQCGTEAVLTSAVAIIVQGTIRPKEYDCGGPNVNKAIAGTSLRIEAPRVVLEEGGTIAAQDGPHGWDRTTQDQKLIGQSGGDGGDVTVVAGVIEWAGTFQAGHGGHGGNLTIRLASPNDLVVQAGDGGRGGSIHLNGSIQRGTQPQAASGAGGHGGHLNATGITLGGHGSPGVNVTGHGGQGGGGGARFIDGEPNSNAPAGRGGDATVAAGDGKNGGNKSADGGAGGTARALAGSGAGWPASAWAFGGHGGHGQEVVVAPCTIAPVLAGSGGRGGDAYATGGQAAPMPIGKAHAVAGDGGKGGDATGHEAVAGDGGDGGRAHVPGQSNNTSDGRGGDGGVGRVQGGAGGEPDGHDGARLGPVVCDADAPSDPYARGVADTARNTPSYPLPLLAAALFVLARRR